MGIAELIEASRYRAEAMLKLKDTKQASTVDITNELFKAINKLNSSFILSQKIQSESNSSVKYETSELSKTIRLLSEKIESLDITNREYTGLINKKGLNASRGYKILDLKGHGKLRELTVSLNVKPDLYVKVNGNELYNIHASFDDLSTISEYSEVVSAITSAAGDNYIINIKEIKFTDSIVISLYFDGNATINNIFCIYDLME